MSLTPERIKHMRDAAIRDRHWAPTAGHRAEAMERLELLDALAEKDAEIERLRGLVAAAHVVRPKLVGATCSCGKWLVRTASDMQALQAHAGHVEAILDGATS